MSQTKPHVAIIYSFNDREKHRYGSRRGIKEQISYFDQFLISRQSILDTWHQRDFTYDFHIVCKEPFPTNKKEHLNSLGVNLIYKPNNFNPFLRSLALAEDIECDYKLILDNDTFATDQPEFDFSKDVQSMFGGCRFNGERIDTICNKMGIKRPSQNPIHDKLSVVYNDYEYGAYYSPADPKEIFPYFNGGAILVKKEIATKIGELIIIMIPKIGNNVWSYQDFIGLAVNHVTENWSPFEKGFNFLINPNLQNIRRIMEEYSGKISLIHYIHSTAHFPQYYNPIMETYKRVKFE